MDCQTVAAWTRDGYVALLFPISLLSTAQVLHQDICSKETEGKRRKRTGKTISFDVGSGEKLIKEEAKDAYARPHSGIRLFVINEVTEDSMEENYKDEGSTEEDINKESNKSEKKIGLCENWEWWLLCVLP